MESKPLSKSDALQPEEFVSKLRAVGSGHVSDAVDLRSSSDGSFLAFTGSVEDTLDEGAHARICIVDVASGQLRVATFGPNDDRSPKISPDGRWIAYLSDRVRRGDAQLWLLDLESGRSIATTEIDGWVENAEWSPDGSQILLTVARKGADTASTQTVRQNAGREAETPSWTPTVDIGISADQWRDAWIYGLASKQAYRVPIADLNIWEANWRGCSALVVIASSRPGEGYWYNAQTYHVALPGGEAEHLYSPTDQVAHPSASPCGTSVAFVEGVASDRGVLIGTLRVAGPEDDVIQAPGLADIDVSSVEWRSDTVLLVTGHRRLNTVVGVLDLASKTFRELWSSEETAGSGRYAAAVGLSVPDDFAMIVEGFLQAPEVGLVSNGSYRTLISFDAGLLELSQYIQSVQTVHWCAEDGLELDGFLVLPHGQPPFPTIMLVHGGPISHWRAHWMGRRGATELALLTRGYALFFPNPRGSSGRGGEFARSVLGDVGGKDAGDLMSGLDAILDAGIADPENLGVMGGSYGGYMASWLVTQSDRFAAAVAVAPLTNWLSALYMSNIPHFVTMALKGSYAEANDLYRSRSPICFAENVRTPVLSICGALDRCTPSAEAVQFHNALLQAGTTSELVTYPEEGHGVRRAPAANDYTAHVLAWFERHFSQRYRPR